MPALRLERIATSLYDDPAAELYEDASARLGEYPAVLGCLILRRASPPSTVGGHQDLAGGHEEAPWPSTESDRLTATQLAAFTPPGEPVPAATPAPRAEQPSGRPPHRAKP